MQIDEIIIPVKDYIVDLINFDENIYFHIITQYINENNFNIIIRRMDGIFGYNGNVSILLNNIITNDTVKIDINDWKENIDYKIKIYSENKIYPENKNEYITLFKPFSELSKKKEFYLKKIQREEFNTIFKTNIVLLPNILIAIGKDYENNFYYYNEYFKDEYFDLKYYEQITNLLNVLLEYKNKDIYFLLSTTDGYPEDRTWSNKRKKIKNVSEFECKNLNLTPLCKEDEYLIFYKKKYILCNSSQIELPYSINIIDRHYFRYNFYNKFRSIHKGINFENKIDKIVYGGNNSNGSDLNFIDPSMINLKIKPREYFIKNIYPNNSDIIDYNEFGTSKENMIFYKYILDIDGGASTWDATAWKLNSGSVIFKPKSIWRQWFYDDYKPWIHYIEISNDFSDIKEKYEWCKNNPDKCKEIIMNCKKLFQKVYSYISIVSYTKNVIDLFIEN